MSRLTTIAARNLKGQTFTASLTGADVFVGPNGAGKSSRLLAVLAARGLAESPNDAAREYLGPTLPKADIRLAWEGGADLTRDLSAKSTSTAGKKASFEADRLMGPHLARWDLGDFARDSDKNRAALLERICAAGDVSAVWTLSKVEALLRKEMGLDRGAALPGGHPLAVAVVTWSSTVPVGTWLTAQAKAVDEEFTTANAAQKKAATDAQVSGEAVDGEELPSGTLAEKRAELVRLKAAGEAAAAAVATARQAGKRGAENDADMEAAAKALSAAQRDLATAEYMLENLPETADLEAAEATATATLAAAESAAALAAHRLTRAATGYDAAKAALAALDGGLEALRALATDASGSCQHCGGEDPLGLAARIATEEAARPALVTAETAAKEAMDARNAVAISAKTAERVARTALDEASRAVRSASADRTRAETTVEAARRGLTAAEKHHAVITARLDAPVEIEAVGDIETLEANAEAIREDYAKIRKEEAALIRHEERQKRQQDAIAERERTAAHFADIKAMKAALAALRAEVAKSAYGPIQDEATAFLAASGLDMEVAFVDEGDFGAKVRQRSGAAPYVAFWALSDAQRAEFAVSLAVAFGVLTKAPWRAVLVDGLEKIEATALAGVLRAGATYVKDGKLDNFIGALVSEQPVALEDGPTLHWLGDTQAAAK